MTTKYELRRCRFRYGTTNDDNGPEGDYFRYEVRIGIFESYEDCCKCVSRIEGDDIEALNTCFQECGWLCSRLKPTGYTTLRYRSKPSPEYYHDEYYIYEIHQ